MAVDKLVDSTQLDADLTSVANAIRTKGGTSAQLAFPAEFVQAIEDIETGGGSYENIAVTLKNAKSSGSMSLYTTQYDDDLEVIIAKTSTRSAGSSTGYSLLKQDNYIGFGVSVAISSVKYDGTAVPFSQTGSGSNRPIRIEIPCGYEYGTPIELS